MNGFALIAGAYVDVGKERGHRDRVVLEKDKLQAILQGELRYPTLQMRKVGGGTGEKNDRKQSTEYGSNQFFHPFLLLNFF